MIGQAETRYLRELGFNYGGQEETHHQLSIAGEISDEAWMLAYHLFEGNLKLSGTTSTQAPQSNQGEANTDEVEALADSILEGALRVRASDIHLEPVESGLRLRYRQDGHLVARPEIPRARRDHLMAHLKIRAGMDIAEKRRPQDGRIHFKGRSRSVDLRVSTLPTQYGEKMVLRLLDKGEISLDLNHLGFHAEDLQKIERIIHAPYGLCLVTGPTGSGKTTTLYSCLTSIRNDSLNIMTIEDPIEYRLPGISQTQVKPDIGVTFAATLRTFLRQDPNIIMVGEIRDEETAELATRAALTGHLVFSTLHTNDAIGTIPRLTEMGVPNHLLGACLSLVIAQRLVRRICPQCRQASQPDERMVRLFGPTTHAMIPYQGQGCEDCSNTGYRGRMGLYEVLAVSADLRDAITRNAAMSELKQIALDSGMKTLAQESARAVAEGHTSVDEVCKEAVL